MYNGFKLSRPAGAIVLLLLAAAASTAAARGLAYANIAANATAAAADGACTISWASSANQQAIRYVTLSNGCPVNSNACSGPSDALQFQDKLTPCCNAHDWCYTCGWKAGLRGVAGRKVCDSTFQTNMRKACQLYFSKDPTSLQSCLSTADAMYSAVTVSQDIIGATITELPTDCPGESWKLAHADFCFDINYELSNAVKTISSGNGGQWGAWTNFAQCPAGSWANGFSARVLAYQGWTGDDSVLNAVQMSCTNRQGSGTATNLKPHSGWAGSWSPYSTCPAGYHITSIRLQVEPPQGALRDDTAANTLEARCNDGRTVLTHSNTLGFGTWSEWVSCPAGTAVCGFKVKIEQDGAIDDTAVNDIEAACCS